MFLVGESGRPSTRLGLRRAAEATAGSQDAQAALGGTWERSEPPGTGWADGAVSSTRAVRHFQPADALADRPDGVGLRRVHGDRAVEHRAVAHRRLEVRVQLLAVVRRRRARELDEHVKGAALRRERVARAGKVLEDELHRGAVEELDGRERLAEVAPRGRVRLEHRLERWPGGWLQGATPPPLGCTLRRAAKATAGFHAAGAALRKAMERPDSSEPPGEQMGRRPPTGQTARFQPAGIADPGRRAAPRAARAAARASSR